MFVGDILLPFYRCDSGGKSARRLGGISLCDKRNLRDNRGIDFKDVNVSARINGGLGTIIAPDSGGCGFVNISNLTPQCSNRRMDSRRSFHHPKRIHAIVYIPQSPPQHFPPPFPPSTFPRHSRDCGNPPFCYLRESANGDLSPKMANPCGGKAAANQTGILYPRHSRACRGNPSAIMRSIIGSPFVDMSRKRQSN